MLPRVVHATKSYPPRGVTADGQVRTMAPLTAIKDMGSADLHVAAASPAAIEATLARCRQLYAGARSAEALPLALEALEAARALGDAFWMRRAGTACGLLAGDTADRSRRTLRVANTQARAAVIAEIEFGGVAIQVSLGNVVIHVDDPALEDREVLFNRAILACTALFPARY